MTERPSVTEPFLIVMTGAYRCALPAANLVEIMRPLPVQSFADLPSFVRGASIIRGEPVPVLDLARLFGGTADGVGRFVVLRVDGRRVAVAVDSVVGFEHLGMNHRAAVPELLKQVQPQILQSLEAADRNLVLVLGNAFMVPDELWSELARMHAHI